VGPGGSHLGVVSLRLTWLASRKLAIRPEIGKRKEIGWGECSRETLARVGFT
jgi:hypothetical protein